MNALCSGCLYLILTTIVTVTSQQEINKGASRILQQQQSPWKREIPTYNGNSNRNIAKLLSMVRGNQAALSSLLPDNGQHHIIPQWIGGGGELQQQQDPHNFMISPHIRFGKRGGGGVGDVASLHPRVMEKLLAMMKQGQTDTLSTLFPGQELSGFFANPKLFDNSYVSPHIRFGRSVKRAAAASKPKSAIVKKLLDLMGQRRDEGGEKSKDLMIVPLSSLFTADNRVKFFNVMKSSKLNEEEKSHISPHIRFGKRAKAV